MGRIVIVAYKPLAGKETELIALVKEHLPVLNKEGLVTDRKPIVMQAADKTIIEVFEWKSAEAIDSAHSNPRVQDLWRRFSAVCNYEKPGNLKEFKDLFAEFQAID